MLDCAMRRSVAARRSRRSPEKPSKHISAAVGVDGYAQPAPDQAVAATSRNGSRRSSPRSSAHRTDRRRRAVVRLHRPRRPPPQRVSRTARDTSRTAARADVGDHRGGTPAWDATGSRNRSPFPRRLRRRQSHRRAGPCRRLAADRSAGSHLPRPSTRNGRCFRRRRSRTAQGERGRDVGPTALRSRSPSERPVHLVALTQHRKRRTTAAGNLQLSSPSVDRRDLISTRRSCEGSATRSCGRSCDRGRRVRRVPAGSPTSSSQWRGAPPVVAARHRSVVCPEGVEAFGSSALRFACGASAATSRA